MIKVIRIIKEKRDDPCKNVHAFGHDFQHISVIKVIN